MATNFSYVHRSWLHYHLLQLFRQEPIFHLRVVWLLVNLSDVLDLLLQGLLSLIHALIELREVLRLFERLLYLIPHSQVDQQCESVQFFVQRLLSSLLDCE